MKFIATHYDGVHVIGIEPSLDRWWNTPESSGDNCAIKFGDAENLEFEDNAFDFAYGVAVFEHIHDVPKALKEIKRVLKPKGKFYSFGNNPIWTSIIGHHVTDPNTGVWNNEILNLIPAWGHLYMSEAEMKIALESNTDDNLLIGKILDMIYRNEDINRKSRTELISAIVESGLIIRHYKELVRVSRTNKPNESDMTREIAEKVVANGYLLSDVHVVGIEFSLEKLSAY